MHDLGSASNHILSAEGGPHNDQCVRTRLHIRAIAFQLQSNPNVERAAKRIQPGGQSLALNRQRFLQFDHQLNKGYEEEILSCLRANARYGQVGQVRKTFASTFAMERLTCAAGPQCFRKSTTMDEFLSFGDVAKRFIERHALSTRLGAAR